MAYATPIRRPPLRILSAAWVALFLCGCFAGARVLGATQTLTPSDDTFINSHNPINNSGGSASVFTGTDGLGGLMRGLIRFDMPAALAGRATVTSAQLKMTTQALGTGAAGTAATESLRAVAEPWIQGNGVGNASTTFTVGQACGGLVTGATWNQSNCTTVTNWSTAGASGAAVSATESGSAAAPALIGAEVTWNSPGMTVDVQAWIDTPAGNHGWRISSSTEGNSTGLAQRFFSTESGASGPSLTFTYDCKSGFLAAGTACTTCSVAANASCAVAQGNACIDSGPPSATYACACNNPAFVPGIDSGGNPACACAMSAPCV